MKFSRRELAMATAGSLLVPVSARGQTPIASTPEIDLRSRDLTDALDLVKPTDLLTALETSPVSEETLHELADGNATVMPWTSFEDRDLRNALGGVMVGGKVDTIDNLVGGYVVFESAEIAYDELVFSLKDAYEFPNDSYTSAGSFVWVIESSANLRVGLTRVGYVQIIAVEQPDDRGIAMPALIEHLTKVAQNHAT